MNKFILNADDFGLSEAFNNAVSDGYKYGILKSASLAANGDAFEEAVNQVISGCPGLGVGVHLNIMEGKSLLDGLSALTDDNQNFNNSWIGVLFKSFCNNKLFLEQVENEFRAQIEKVRSAGVEITHLDSHVHTHAIPPLFKIVCKLAQEYGIKQVRTQFEKPYLIPDGSMYLNIKYYINLIKVLLLVFFTVINGFYLKHCGLDTNNYQLGVSYTSMMNSMTVLYGLNALKHKKGIVAEALIHPCVYDDGTADNHIAEYKITKDEDLKEKILQMGFEITNYKNQ